MILFFDTETTGKADFRSPPDAPNQPRLVQLAAILTNHNGDELASIDLTIKPVGYEIPTEASNIHGITTELATLSGVPEITAMRVFDNLLVLSETMTPICKLPGRYGDYKWPKLQEAYQHAFGKPFEGAHDALADVRACKEVYFWWLAQQKPSEPIKDGPNTAECDEILGKPHYNEKAA